MQKNAGFTLIELLVVVLIIGILASVALPQYEIAVAKSRVAQILPFMSSVKAAQEAYYMANSAYADRWEDLDISIPGNLTLRACVSGGRNTQCIVFPSGVTCLLQSGGGSLFCSGGTSDLPEIGVAYDNGLNMGDLGARTCFAVIGSKREKICKALGGRFVKSEYGQNRYSF